MKSTTPKQGVLERQFGQPSGILGSLIGMAMAVEHKTLHKEVVERLALMPADKVLEIGFGPGTALRLAAVRAGFVAGIEPSREMVAQATRRNRSAIRSGRVEILRASAEAIPFGDDSFTVVFEVNSLHHWADPEVGLREVFRVLEVGGRFMSVLRHGHGELKTEVARVVSMLEKVGFKQMWLEEHQLGHGGAFVMAQK